MRTQRSASIVDHAVSMAVAILAILALAGFRLEAQSAAMVKLVIVKKPGAADGNAMATVKAPINVKGKVTLREKTGRIATHARQAWIIMNGQGALLLLSPEKKGGPYQLRYYQLDEGKGRSLGEVPFAQATLEESQAASAPWAFALSGTDSSTTQPVIVAGDSQAIHARLPNASDPHFCADALCFRSVGGQSAAEPGTLTIQQLLGKKRLATFTPRARPMRESPISSSFPTEMPSLPPQKETWKPGAGLPTARRFGSLPHNLQRDRRRGMLASGVWPICKL